MENKYDEKVVKVLCYFDLFSYPLTFQELVRYYPDSINTEIDSFREALRHNTLISMVDGYYCLLGRENIATLRQEREEISLLKMSRALIFSKILSRIPTILLIGISGSLSMNNAQSTDDIDFFIITRKNSLWITRLFVVALLLVFGQKRSRFSKEAKDKVCTNMFLSEDVLQIPRRDQNLYIAHEIAQLKTVYSRNDMYENFFASNRWMYSYFPNIQLLKRKGNSKENKIVDYLLLPIETIMFLSQKIYMRKYVTIEKIASNSAKFHPVNKPKIILAMYRLRVKKYFQNYKNIQDLSKDEVQFYFENYNYQKTIN